MGTRAVIDHPRAFSHSGLFVKAYCSVFSVDVHYSYRSGSCRSIRCHFILTVAVLPWLQGTQTTERIGYNGGIPLDTASEFLLWMLTLIGYWNRLVLRATVRESW